jgi:cell division protein FtsQ
MRIFVLLLLLALSLVGLIHDKGFLLVNEIEVGFEDPQLLQSPYWKSLITKIKPQLAYFENKNTWQISLSKIANQLQKETWVKDVSVSRTWPNKIKIKIKNKTPEVLVLDSEGRLHPVDQAGELLPIMGWNESSGEPILRGNNFLAKFDLRKKMLDFFSQLPAEGPFSKKQISDILYNESEGFIATLVWKSLQVKLGFEPSTLVSLRISQVIDYLQTRNINVRVIDANFSKKVLVKMRNQP